MQIGDTIVLSAVSPPAGVELLDDSESVIATLSPPRLQTEAEEEIEAETELVGEGEGQAAEDAGEGSAAEGSGGE